KSALTGVGLALSRRLNSTTLRAPFWGVKAKIESEKGPLRSTAVKFTVRFVSGKMPNAVLFFEYVISFKTKFFARSIQNARGGLGGFTGPPLGFSISTT